MPWFLREGAARPNTKLQKGGRLSNGQTASLFSGKAGYICAEREGQEMEIYWEATWARLPS